MKKDIKNIIFDFGNVIVDLNREACVASFAEIGIDVKPLLGLSRQQGIFYELETGMITPTEWCQQLILQAEKSTQEKHAYQGSKNKEEEKQTIQVPRSRITPLRIQHAWNQMLAGIPLHRLKMLQELGKHYHIALLSNTNEVHISYSFEAHFRAQGYEPTELFEHIFLSHEMHLSKPNRDIYESVLEQSGYLPEETLFIDDSAENCEAFAQLRVKTFVPRWPDEWIGHICPTVATIGFFDGVHQGHRYLIEQVVEEAKRRQMRSLLITFAEHPRSVLHADYTPQLLTTAEEKQELLSHASIDFLEMLHFTPEMSRLTAPQFMQQILHDRYGVHVLVMGYDHRFGHNGGTLAEYQEWGRQIGIEVLQAAPLPLSHPLQHTNTPNHCIHNTDYHTDNAGQHIGNTDQRTDESDHQIITPSHYTDNADDLQTINTVSSSSIRHLLSEGCILQANQMLGYPYALRGEVISGQQIGHSLGFPTANLHISSHKLIPARGVYAVWVQLDEHTYYPGMLNIGTRPTITHATAQGDEQTIEVNLIHFEGNLYHHSLTLHFVDFLRHEQRFESREALSAQLQDDELRTLEILQQHPHPLN